METPPSPRSAGSEVHVGKEQMGARVSRSAYAASLCVCSNTTWLIRWVQRNVKGGHKVTPRTQMSEVHPLAIGVLHPSWASPCEAQHGLGVLLKFVRCRGLSVVCSFCAALASSCYRKVPPSASISLLPLITSCSKTTWMVSCVRTRTLSWKRHRTAPLCPTRNRLLRAGERTLRMCLRRLIIRRRSGEGCASSNLL